MHPHSAQERVGGRGGGAGGHTTAGDGAGLPGSGEGERVGDREAWGARCRGAGEEGTGPLPGVGQPHFTTIVLWSSFGQGACPDAACPAWLGVLGWIAGALHDRSHSTNGRLRAGLAIPAGPATPATL